MGEAAAKIEQQAYVVRVTAASAKLDKSVDVRADSANEAIREVLAGLTPDERKASDIDVKLRLGDEIGLAPVELPAAAPENDNAAPHRDTISGGDESSLMRFFGNARAERSPSGAILDIALLYSRPRPGDPGYEPPPQRDYGEDPPAGIELLETLDAQPTRESRESSRDGPDDETLLMLGLVGRRLDIVRRLDPLSYTVLSAFYGDAGAVHALGDYGREGSLVAYTKAGQKLARIGARKSRGSKRKASAVEHVRNEMNVAIIRARSVARNLPGATSSLVHTSGGEESTLIARGLAEARDLLARAARAWNSTPKRKVNL